MCHPTGEDCEEWTEIESDDENGDEEVASGSLH